MSQFLSVFNSGPLSKLKLLFPLFIIESEDEVIHILATCSFALQRVIEIMDEGSMVFTGEEAKEANECLHLHLKCYFWLASYHYEKRALLYKLRCKSHYLFHIADDIIQFSLNPAMFYTFDEESFLGKIKRICVRCHGSTCTHRIFMRLILCMAMFVEQYRKTEKLMG